MSQNVSLALIAHDRYKEMLAYFVLDHRAEFSRFHLVATLGTGKMVQNWTGLKVCDIHEIPVATNRATAEALIYFLLNSPDRGAITARPWGFVHKRNEAREEDIQEMGKLDLRIGA